jgi:hypothetical protein
MVSALMAGLLVLVCAAVAWYWRLPTLVQRRLEQATSRRVRVGSVGLTWRGQIALGDVEIAGAPPFESRTFAHIDRAVVGLRGPAGLLAPSQVVVDGMDIDYLATSEGDNLRGPGIARKSSSTAAARPEKTSLPTLTVHHARLRGTVSLAFKGHIAFRAPEIEISRDGEGRIIAELHRMVIDAEGMASVRAQAIALDVLRGRPSMVSGNGISVEVPGGGTMVDNLTLDGQWSPAASTFELHSNESSERQVVASASWNPQSVEIATKLRALPLRALGMLAGGRALGLDSAKADLQARAVIDRSVWRADFEASGKISAVDVLHPAVDSVPWRNQTAGFSVKGNADLANDRLELSEASLKMLGATLKAKATVENLRSPRGSISVFTPPHEPLSCSNLLFAEPDPVRRALEGLELQGNLGFELSLKFDSAAWQELALDVAVGPVCSVRSEARALAALLPVLRKPKSEQPPAGLSVPLGTYHPDYVPLSQMPAHLPSAFITSEDSKFFHHQGFDTDMIRNALAQDLGNRSFDRGASTITQQLAKNLFLTHRRTLARKLEEAVLTWRLQKLLSKDRVLELYLNVIELGPGIRGVKQAARTYFGKEVGELAPLESAHLAALTPNPHVLARRFRDGQVDEGWQQRLIDLLGMMKRHRRLTPEELAAARASKLELRDLGRDPAVPRQN